MLTAATSLVDLVLSTRERESSAVKHIYSLVNIHNRRVTIVEVNY